MQNEFDNTENYFDDNDNVMVDAEAEIEEISLPYTIAFNTPLKFGKTERTEIVFRNSMTIGMIKHFPIDQDKHPLKMGHFFPIISQMTGEVPQLVDKLEAEAFGECMKVVSYFLGKLQVATK